MPEFLLAAVVAGLVGVLSVPLVIGAARRRGLLDRPDCGRRWHLVAVPRLGGVAVWAGAAAGLAVLAITVDGVALTASQMRLVLAFVAALALTFGVGLLDDLRGVSPLGKFLAQCIAAVILVAGGFRLDTIALTSQVVLELGWLSVPATLFWVIGVTNAFNLIDGLDGLAGGVALIALLTTGAASLLLGNPIVLGLIVPLAAAVAGFLRYNVSPARIFLGDVGSLTLGLTLAVLVIEGTRRPDGAVYFPVALFAVAFPLLDTCTAMLRRWLRGVPVTAADDRHVHHQLVALGLSHRRAAALIWLFAAVVAGFGLSVSLAPPALTLVVMGLGAGAFVLVIVHGARWLHYHEFAEAQASFASGLWTARSVIRDRIRARELANQIGDAGSLDEIISMLEEHGASLGFDSLTLREASDLRVRSAVTSAVSEQRPQLIVPVAGDGANARDRLLILASWRLETRRPPLYAERVMRILVPVIEASLARLRWPEEETVVGAVPVGRNEAYAATPTVAMRSRRVADAAPR